MRTRRKEGKLAGAISVIVCHWLDHAKRSGWPEHEREALAVVAIAILEKVPKRLMRSRAALPSCVRLSPGVSTISSAALVIFFG